MKGPSIAQLIKKLAGSSAEFLEPYGVPCFVVGPATETDGVWMAKCRPINGDADLLDVRLQADPGNGLLIIPAEDSIVMVQPINELTGYISMFSQVETIKFLDGSFGGLTKTQELKTQLDKTNAVVQAIVDSLTNWTTAPNDGGAALKAFFATQIAGKTVGDFGDIENDLITHGTN